MQQLAADEVAHGVEAQVVQVVDAVAVEPIAARVRVAPAAVGLAVPAVRAQLLDEMAGPVDPGADPGVGS